ncbi:MAG: hypothetical protein MAG715_01171 [Methanonatronarchaeales archaeon]|nr:hypothetical protein [Methanonatronarchaeales archaeon]
MRVLGVIGTRPDVSVESAKVAAGDVAVLALFVVVGESFHSISPLSFPWLALDTFLPFFIAWVLLAPVSGAYGRDARSSARGAVVHGTVAWSLVSLLGQAIRASPYFHGGTGVEFFVVTLVTGMLFLLPWRIAASRWLKS